MHSPDDPTADSTPQESETPNERALQRPPSEPVHRDLGRQPIAAVMEELGLRPADLVAKASEQLTHKMVSRACKGRRLTSNTQGKVHRALEAAAGKSYQLTELFTYVAK